MSSISGYLFDDIKEFTQTRVHKKSSSILNAKEDIRSREVSSPPKNSVRKVNKIISTVNPYSDQEITGLSTRNISEEKATIRDLALKISVEFPEITTLNYYGLVSLFRR